MRATQLIPLITVMFLHTVFAFSQDMNKEGNRQNAEPTFLELPHFEVIPIKDTALERNYELYVKLPNSYSENTNVRYPVVYFTDAMWHLEILSAATEYMLEEVILVGISWQKDINEDLKAEVGDHVSRFRDYSMQETDRAEIQAKYNLGQANKHLSFIRNDVMNYVDDKYRTDPRSRTYFGYSLGGEFGAYILLTQPHTFNNYIIGSPSIKNEISYLSELSEELRVGNENNYVNLNANVFISHGTLETEMVEPIGEFVKLLKGRRDKGLSLQKVEVEGDHQTAFPLTAIKSVAWLATLLNDVSKSTDGLSFFDVPQMNKAFISTVPEERSDSIPTGELGVDGGDKEIILALTEDIQDHSYGYFDSFLIYHKDKLVFESYYSRGRINAPHPQASATKAYTSLALGRAIQMGYLSMDDLNKPLMSFFKELDPSKFVKGAELVTLHKALTMSTGIRISEEKRDEFEKNPDLIKGQKQVQTMLEHSAPITTDSQQFLYGTGPNLVMQVLNTVVPGSAKEFIETELLDKLGITNYEWQTSPSGLPEAGWRTSMTSRDMIKWGMLTQNKGEWNGEQLISEEYLDRALSRILLTGDDDVYGGGKDVSKQGYGYYWWSGDLKYEGKTYFCQSAQGGGGQYIILVEDLDVMVVVTGHDNDNTTLQMIAERVLPAFIN